MNTEATKWLETADQIRLREVEKRKVEEHEAIKKHQDLLMRTHTWRTCLNCDNWSQNKCIKFKAVPPPHVIVNGCKDWEDDIPF